MLIQIGTTKCINPDLVATLTVKHFPGEECQWGVVVNGEIRVDSGADTYNEAIEELDRIFKLLRP